MTNFDMKQWLTQNKVGPYSKMPLNESDPRDYDDDDDIHYDPTEDERDEGPDDYGDGPHDLYGLSAMKGFSPMDEYSSGEDHVDYDDEKPRMPFAGEKPNQDKYKIQRSGNGSVIAATNQYGDTFKVGDTAKLAPQDNERVVVINSFIEQQGKVKALYSEHGTAYSYDIDGLDPVKKVNETDGGKPINKKIELTKLLYKTTRYDRTVLLDLIDELVELLPTSQADLIYDKIKAEVDTYEREMFPDYELDYDTDARIDPKEQMGVGYVMKTKKSNPKY